MDHTEFAQLIINNYETINPYFTNITIRCVGYKDMMKNIWKKLPEELKYTDRTWLLREELEDTRSNLRLCIITSSIIIIAQIINYYF